MKEIIMFVAGYTQHIAESQSEAEGIAVILFLSLCAGAVLMVAVVIGWCIANIADKSTNKSKQTIA